MLKYSPYITKVILGKNTPKKQEVQVLDICLKIQIYSYVLLSWFSPTKCLKKMSEEARKY